MIRRRTSLRNPHLARLDREIKRQGEPIELRYQVGTNPNLSFQRINTRGIVRTLGIQQLVGGVAQNKYCIIISPTDLHRQQFRSGRLPATVAAGGLPTGHNPPLDPAIPVSGTGNSVILRGRTAAIERVDAVYSDGQPVRIELYVAGFQG